MRFKAACYYSGFMQLTTQSRGTTRNVHYRPYSQNIFREPSLYLICAQVELTSQLALLYLQSSPSSTNLAGEPMSLWGVHQASDDPGSIPSFCIALCFLAHRMWKQTIGLVMLNPCEMRSSYRITSSAGIAICYSCIYLHEIVLMY